MELSDQMEGKAVLLEMKASPEGIIEGYASLFGEVDQGGDTIAPGAYKSTLAEASTSGRRIKMLWQHDPSQPIGVWEEAREDERGLWVKGRILKQVARGAEALSLVEAGAMDGLSIGYKTRKAAPVKGGGRVLQELDLWEVSVVTFPMQSTARINSVKAEDLTRRDFEEILTQDAKLSRLVARQLMAGGLQAVRFKQDAEPGVPELAEYIRQKLSNQ